MAKKRNRMGCGYGFIADPPLWPAPRPAEETNTVRVADLLAVVSRALKDYPEARLALAKALTEEVRGGGEAQVQP